MPTEKLNEIDSDLKIVNYRLDAMDESVKKLEAVVAKLADISERQVAFHEKIINVFKELSEIQKDLGDLTTVVHENQEAISNFRFGGWVAGGILSLVLVIAGTWASSEINSLHQLKDEYLKHSSLHLK